MTLIVTANIAGYTRGEPVRLPDRRRRRLSTIIARHQPASGRRFIVSVRRRGETFLRPTDSSVRLRSNWCRTLVSPDDTVLITVVPLGGKGMSIRLTIASLALIVLVPYAAPALAGAAVFGAGVGATSGSDMTPQKPPPVHAPLHRTMRARDPPRPPRRLRRCRSPPPEPAAEGLPIWLLGE
ncbi:hypothetical protein [Methylorubrum extorquens]|uniref:hypothetical protein n=1 Tax=Methylorubrum extorquens TaxID=408 RepID=UPI001EE4F023|nr:hypothetical protein [Methylorubrum extorquens]MCG5249631.1 hypothetical protein [Methylorubrum extorquens]